jgi:hypothetical protein
VAGRRRNAETGVRGRDGWAESGGEGVCVCVCARAERARRITNERRAGDGGKALLKSEEILMPFSPDFILSGFPPTPPAAFFLSTLVEPQLYYGCRENLLLSQRVLLTSPGERRIKQYSEFFI